MFARYQFITNRRVTHAINFVAGYSFTLDLIHHSITEALYRLRPGDGYGRFFCTVIGSNLIAAAIATQTEMRHKQFARFLREVLSTKR
jgi:hypothetical protein